VTRIDLHPEALIDAEHAGTLDARGAARLAEHRASCVACATERALVESLWGDLAAGDAEHAREDGVATAAERAIGARIVAQMFEAEARLTDGGMGAASAATTDAAPSRSKQARRRWPYLAVAAILAVGASAAAWRTLTPTVVGPSLGTQVGQGRRLGKAGAQGDPSLARADRSTAVVLAQPSGETEAAVASARSRVERAAEVAGSGATGSRETGSQENSGVDLHRADAAALFSAANLARRSGRQAESVALYRALQRRFPGSREELVSRVTLGFLLLDRLGRPGEALPLFESYLAIEHDGVMDEEARVGLARALGRLDRRAEERRALEGLLSRHPEGVHAATARARLAVLEQ